MKLVRQAMILAAGFGERLRPFTEDTAKPALTIAGKPLIRHCIEKLQASSVERVIVNTHHRPDDVRSAVGLAPAGMSIEYSHEPQILGTGGGIRKVREWFVSQPTFVLNSDTLVEVDLQAAASRFFESGALATMVLREHPQSANYGAVMAYPSGRIFSVANKGLADIPTDARPFLFTGVHVIDPGLLDYLPLDNPKPCINSDGYVRAIRDGRMISCYIASGFWSDLGTPQRIIDGVLSAILDERLDTIDYDYYEIRSPGVAVSPRADVDPSAELKGPLVIDARARVAGDCTIGPKVLLGEGAVVEEGCLLQDAWVTPDSRAAAGISIDRAMLHKGSLKKF